MERRQPPEEPALTFEDLYAAYRRSVPRWVCLYGVKTAGDREDAAQEVWVDVHRALVLFNPNKGTARAWISGIARNTANEWKRTQKRRPEFGVSVDDKPTATTGTSASSRSTWTERTSETEALENEGSEALWKFFERAVPNDDQREAFLLHVIEEMTIDEVAQATSTPPRTVKWRIAMAQQKLKEQMTDEERRKLSAILPAFTVEAFVQAMRDTSCSDEENAIVWERVKAKIEAEGGSVHDRLGSGQTAPAPKVYSFSRPRLVATLTGVFLAGAFSGALVSAWLWPAKTLSSTPIQAEVTLAPLPLLPEPNAPVSAAPTAKAAPSAAVPENPSGLSPDDFEGWLLDRARTAEPLEALAMTATHSLRFPNSPRAATREEIAIRALIQLGRREEAEKRAEALVKWAPKKQRAVDVLLGR